MEKRTNWNQIVEEEIPKALEFFQSEGVKPTLRTLFYRLVSLGLIPNTRSAYKQLSRKLVQARKKGLFAWDFLEDKVRYTIDKYDATYRSEEDLTQCKERCEYRLENIDIKRLIENEFGWLTVSDWIGFWAKQPVTVELWIEKDALAATFDSWLSDLEITIRVNRGYSSWTFIYENVQALKRKLEDHDKIVILYAGDLDPSGVDIERFLREALDYFGITQEQVIFKRVAITEDQVDKYNLPPRPEDIQTLQKLERDPRYKKYNKQYIVELDALVAIVPEEFREELRSTILQYHDEKIYEETREEAKRIREESKKIVEEYKKKALKKILEQAKELLEE